MRCRVVSPVLVACALGATLAAGPGPAYAQNDAYRAALQDEHAHRFANALADLHGAQLTPRQKAHAVVLRAAVGAFDAAEFYTANHQPEQTRDALERLRPLLDPARDRFVMTAWAPKLAAAEQALVKPKPKAKDKSFWDKLGDDLSSAGEKVSTWLLILAGLALLLALGALVRSAIVKLFGPRRGIGLVATDASADPTNRTHADAALNRELILCIQATGAEASEGLRPEIDLAKDLDGSVPLNVRVVGGEVGDLEPYLDNSQQVKIGPVAISPKQLVMFVRGLARRPFEWELRGGLATAQDGSARFTGELVSDKRTVMFSSADANHDGRLKVLAEVAERVLFEIGGSAMSKNWKSVCCCREAMATLRKAGPDNDQREQALEHAEQLLKRSLLHDPSNPLARFELATVLRKLGRNDEAVEQYELLESGPAGRAPATPTVRRAAVYSRALALMKLETWRAIRQAMEALDEVEQEVAADPDPEVEDVDRARMRTVVRSARAAARVVELELLRRSTDADARRQAVLDEIEQAVTDVRDAADPDWPEYVQALAVAENALGRALYLLKKPNRDMISAFERALSLAPDLGDAHVNLASALLRQKPYPGRDERIQRHLERALKLSPRDCHAMVLCAQLALARDEPQEARKWYTQAIAEDDQWARFSLAELDWTERDFAAGLDGARRSLAAAPGTDRRASTLVMWTVACLDDPEREAVVTTKVLVAARRAAKSLNAEAQRLDRPLSKRLGPAVQRLLGDPGDDAPPNPAAQLDAT